MGRKSLPLRTHGVAIVAFLVGFNPLLYAQSERPSMCVAPNDARTPEGCAPGLCASGPLSFKIDDRLVMQWPKNESLEINDLDATTRHRIIIYRAGKPQQSFKFRFSEYRSNRVCLFLNDFYWTAQLWEAKRSPWCKCK